MPSLFNKVTFFTRLFLVGTAFFSMQNRVFSAEPVVPPPQPRFWDNQWTSGRSNTAGFDLIDKDTSHGKSGEDPPQKYFMPPKLNYDDVEFKELHNTTPVRDYNPEALLQLHRTIKANGKTLSPGYYLVSLGHRFSGSFTVRYPGDQAAGLPPQVDPATPEAMILKQAGKVMAVLPISSVSVYANPKPFWKKYKKQLAVAQLVTTDQAQAGMVQPNAQQNQIRFKDKHFIVTATVQVY